MTLRYGHRFFFHAGPYFDTMHINNSGVADARDDAGVLAGINPDLKQR